MELKKQKATLLRKHSHFETQVKALSKKLAATTIPAKNMQREGTVHPSRSPSRRTTSPDTRCSQSKNKQTMTHHPKLSTLQFSKPMKQESASSESNKVKESSYLLIQQTAINASNQRKKRKSQRIILKRKKKVLDKMFVIANSIMLQTKQPSSPTRKKPSPFLLFNSPTFKFCDKARFLLPMPPSSVTECP
jgi:hypothetical protein